MRQRSFIALAAAIAILLVGSVAVYAYDSSNDDQIAHGVKAGGVDIGDMSTSAARAKLQRELALKLNRPLEAVYKHRSYRLDPRSAKVRIDVKGMVDQALQKSRSGNIVSRTVRGVFGGSVKTDIPVRVSYDHAAVAALVKHVAKGVDRPARWTPASTSRPACSRRSRRTTAVRCRRTR